MESKCANCEKVISVAWDKIPEKGVDAVICSSDCFYEYLLDKE